MRMETVTHGSHCFDLMCSGTSLCHANGQCYAWFALFRAEVMWKGLLNANVHCYVLFLKSADGTK